jgi:hypothetical protein
MTLRSFIQLTLSFLICSSFVLAQMPCNADYKCNATQVCKYNQAICANAVGYPTTEFYPFGTGDFDFTNLMETDDSGVKFTFGVDLKFFDVIYDTIYFTTNGIACFTSYFPTGLSYTLLDNSSPLPMIAAFWADVDSTTFVPNESNKIWFGATADPTIVNRATEEVRTLYPRTGLGDGSESTFTADFVMSCTWWRVAKYATTPSVDPLNTFQLVIVWNSQQTYIMYHYAQLRWVLSSGRFARAGLKHFDLETSETGSAAELLFSGTRGIGSIARYSNVNVTGKFIVRADTAFDFSQIVGVDTMPPAQEEDPTPSEQEVPISSPKSLTPASNINPDTIVTVPFVALSPQVYGSEASSSTSAVIGLVMCLLLLNIMYL